MSPLKRQVVALALLTTAFSGPAQAQSAGDIARGIMGNGPAGDLANQAVNGLIGMFKKKPTLQITDMVAAPALKDPEKYSSLIAMSTADYNSLIAQCDSGKPSGALKRTCKTTVEFRKWQDTRKTLGFDVVPSIIEGQFAYAPAGTTDSVFNWTATTTTTKAKKGTPASTTTALPFLAGTKFLPVIGADGNKSNVEISTLQTMAQTGALNGFKIERVTDAEGRKIGDGNILRLTAFQGETLGTTLYVDKNDLMRIVPRNTLTSWLGITDPRPQAAPEQRTPAGPTIPIK